MILAANKCEGRAAEPGIYEAFALGLGDPLPISAEHGTRHGRVERRHRAGSTAGRSGAARSRSEASDEEDAVPHPLRIAVVGRPNVGKSTLVNACSARSA